MKNKPNVIIATKTEALWTKVKNAQTIKIEDLENELIVCREVLKLAEGIIANEK